MSSEFLERKKKALDAAIAAAQSLQAALQELPPDWARDILEGLVKGQEEQDEQSPNPEVARQSEAGLLPTEAVRDLLRKHPEGLTVGEVVKSLRDRIQTTSKNPSKLLYSTLAILLRNGKVEKLSDGRHRLRGLTDEQST
jgi:hypothetical protein